jgi:hypothetical protein
MKKSIKTFEEFSQAVEDLAGGKYFAVRMEKTMYGRLPGEPRESKYEYKCYIDGWDWHTGDSPEEVIVSLKKSTGLVPAVVIEAEIK